MPCRVGVRFEEDDCDVLSTGPPIVAVGETVVTIATRLPRWRMVKNLPVNAGGAKEEGSVPWSGISPGEEDGSPLHSSCLDYPRGA